MLIAAVFIVSLVPAISFAATTTSLEKTDDGSVKIASKAKVAKYKVTWNGNGGKIGSKKTVATSVKKGSKLAKLAKSPKRSGYTFKGWYTKKSGGTKITKNTKPKKSVTYYAQWKKAKALNAQEKKLVGTWYGAWSNDLWNFNNDGTFTSVWRFSSYDVGYQGFYSVKNGVLTLQQQSRRDYGSGWQSWSSSSTVFYGIEFEPPKDGRLYVTMDYKNTGTKFSYYKKV